MSHIADTRAQQSTRDLCRFVCVIMSDLLAGERDAGCWRVHKRDQRDREQLPALGGGNSCFQ